MTDAGSLDPGGAILVPDEQRARQACASLAGHLFQAVRAASAWSYLKPGEQLLLEVAEDYATLSQAVLSMTQAKHEIGTVTLRSPGVRKALAGLIPFQDANPDIQVRLAYLTTADVAVELGSPLPDGEGGIAYWQRAARGAVDVEPLRQLLLETQLDEDLLAFLRTADAHTLRERLIEPVAWLTQSDGLHAAQAGLEARLGSLAVARTGYAEDGVRAVPFLVYGILARSIAQRRVLTSEDFEEVWTRATSFPISVTLARQMIAQGITGDDTVHISQSAPPPPLSPRLAQRRPLVDNCLASLERADVLWIHGSARLGKSQLARLIAARSNTRWTFVALKDKSDAQRAVVLQEAIGRIGDEDFGGLIIDDLPVPASEALRHWIAAIALEISAARRARLIVTSERLPLPQIRHAFSPLTIATEEAPYLLLEDVADIVTASGGQAEAWAGPVFLTCGTGHPLLVDARVAGLATRSWPASDRLEGLGIGNIPSEVAEAREEVTLALLDELSPDAHMLLLRLSGILGTFDRGMVEAVAAIAPPIGRAGALFTMLVGPWVEPVAKDRYKLSALLGSAGTNLNATERAAIHEAIIDALVSRNPFPGDLLSPLVFHAMMSRNLKGFMFIVKAVMNSDRRALAPSLLPLTFMRSGDNGLLLPEAPQVSLMLRLAQLMVGFQLPDANHGSLLSQALAEIEQQPGILREANFHMAALTVLGVEGVELSPDLWMPLLVRYQTIIDDGSLPPPLYEGLASTDLGGLTPDQFFFLIRSNKIHRIAELRILFDALDVIDPVWRMQLLKAGPILLKGPPLFIQSAWSAEALNKTLDARAGEEIYADLARRAVGWGEELTAIECFRSRAVLLDEYLGRQADALSVLDEAELLYPGDAKLQRSRATVLGNMGCHQEEHDLLAALPPDYSAEEPLERILMLRSAAISAGKAGDFSRSAQLFHDAYDLALGEQPLTLGAGVPPGLLADAGVMALCDGDIKGALSDLARAIERLEATAEFSEDVSYKFALNAIDNVCQWGCAGIEGRSFPVDLSKTPGICSTLRPDAEADTSSPRQPNQSWYLLANLEAIGALDGGVADRLTSREVETGVVTRLAMAVSARWIERALEFGDSARFFVGLRRYGWLCGLLLTHRQAPDAIADLIPLNDMPEPEAWNDNEAHTARAAVAGIIIRLLTDERPHEAAAAARQAEAISPRLAGFVESLSPADARSVDWMSSGVASVSWLLDHPSPSPEQLLQASVTIFTTVMHLALPPVSRAVHGLLARHWLSLSSNRRALLSTPRHSVPAIEAAAALPASLPAIARLIEAGSLGSALRLPADLVETLRATMDTPPNAPG